MKITQDDIDELLNRTAMAALFYYPEIVVDDEQYNVHKDVDYCLQAVSDLDDEDIERLRVAVGRVITNPTAHRGEFLALVIELAPLPLV